MSVLTFPSIRNPSFVEFWLDSNIQTFESPLSHVIQTVELPGARWKASLTYNMLSETDSRVLNAFLAQLRGPSGRFYLPNWAHPEPSGTALGTPLVNGGAQTGTTLITYGWQANQSQLLLKGDFIEVGGELKIIVDDATSDSGGNATLSIEPPLRTSPTYGESITTSSPKAKMMLLPSSTTILRTRSPRISSITIQCMEDIA